MELIETCINKEPNANPNDVSPNASPSVVIVEAIAKVSVSTMPLDVKEANVSRPIEVEGGKVCGIAKSKGIENFGGNMFTGGEGYHHYLLPEALPIHAQEDPFMIKLDQ
jgi:hypothetical protein